jgi:hypothetical protein
VVRSVLDLGDLRDLGAWQGPVERLECMERMEGFRAPLPHCDLRPGRQPRRMHQVAGLAVPHRSTSFHVPPVRDLVLWQHTERAWQHGSSGPLTSEYIDRVNET